jgi:hypothetical protein
VSGAAVATTSSVSARCGRVLRITAAFIAPRGLRRRGRAAEGVRQLVELRAHVRLQGDLDPRRVDPQVRREAPARCGPATRAGVRMAARERSPATSTRPRSHARTSPSRGEFTAERGAAAPRTRGRRGRCPARRRRPGRGRPLGHRERRAGRRRRSRAEREVLATGGTAPPRIAVVAARMVHGGLAWQRSGVEGGRGRLAEPRARPGAPAWEGTEVVADDPRALVDAGTRGPADWRPSR